MMVLHRSCVGALFLGGQKRPMRWQTHRYEWMFCFWIHRWSSIQRDLQGPQRHNVEAASVFLKNFKLRRVYRIRVC
ncbi:BnaC06g05110D [Brassica napus]|uniref:BnaC06g05110D protein n=3 Tax=Brassica TaxID=3705 RepID=A0A078H8I1_BRANA|nr:BnaC06g05110D [Brassica napus]VDD60362.1 unnamed protein product [Brassica oleracea]